MCPPFSPLCPLPPWTPKIKPLLLVLVFQCWSTGVERRPLHLLHEDAIQVANYSLETVKHSPSGLRGHLEFLKGP